MAKKKGEFPKEGQLGYMVLSRDLFFRPNNYRRQIKLGVWYPFFHRKRSTDPFVSTGKVKYVPSNGSYYFYDYMPQVTLRLTKNTLTAMWQQNRRGKHKEVYELKGAQEQQMQRVKDITLDIRQKLDMALRQFLRENTFVKFNKFNPTWEHYEEWIKGEEYIDSIPKDLIIHDTVFKKVYDKGIEFTGKKGDEPGVRIKNYIKNRAIEDISPEIAKQLENIYFKLDTKQSEYELCKEVIEESEDIASMLRSLKQGTVQRLPEEERELLTKKIHRRFGV